MLKTVPRIGSYLADRKHTSTLPCSLLSAGDSDDALTAMAGFLTSGARAPLGLGAGLTPLPHFYTPFC